MTAPKKFDHYPSTKNYKIISALGIPHPFCISKDHIQFAVNNFDGVVNMETLIAYEDNVNKESCGIKDCKLSCRAHKHLLVIEMPADSRKPGEIPELKEYMESCSMLCKKEGYAGFVFIQRKPKFIIHKQEYFK